MIRTLGGVLDRLEGNLGPKAVVESAGRLAAPGAAVLLGGHKTHSVCTSLKPYSAYTTSGDKAMDLIRLPRRFLDDHDERMCDDPDVPLVVRVKETARFAWVARNDPGLADLRNDAEYYAASAVPGGLSEGYEWCGRAAKTLLRLLDEAGWVPRDFEEAKEMTTCKTCKQPLTVIGLLGWCDNMACLDYDAHYAAGPRHDKEDQR